VALQIDIGCNNCNKKNNGCCKYCFEFNKTNIFSTLSDKELEYLIDEKQQILYNKGETIIKQNTSSAFVVCIKEGLGKVYVESDKGKNVIIRLVKHGDFVTGGGLFNGNIQHFSIAALTPVTCCLINSSKLANLVAENNEFAISLLRNHTMQNNFLLEKLVNHTLKYMPGRVADTLLYLKKDIFGENTFDVRLTRSELAEMSNMTKESFVRILQQFKESKLINTKGSEIEILDENSLLSISKNG